jgi:ATP-dependent RNA helicase DeaD
MTLYRLEVGSQHGAEAKHIVGALINEAGLESQYIQDLKINDTHSIVNLPEGMPKEIYKQLYKTWVAGQQIKLRDLSQKKGSTSDKKRSHHKNS